MVLIVCDGLRPDSVSEAQTPALWQLASRGVMFRNHHSVYPTLTNVNSTALATGVFPNRSGLLANYEFRPEIDSAKFIRTDELRAVQKGDELAAGKYLAVPTTAEAVQASGGWTAIAGTKTTTLLHNRKPSAKSVTIFAGDVLPTSAGAEITRRLGSFPRADQLPNEAQDAWTTRALVEGLWREGVPLLSVLWLSEPDRSEHASSPGSETALAAVRSCDTQVATVLRSLESKGVSHNTDIFVASDHGFSTVGRPIELRERLKSAGFRVTFDGETAGGRGHVRVVGNGGTALFYIAEHDEDTTARLTEWLQQSDFAGVIFSPSAREGAFLYSEVHLETPSAPDLVMAFCWADQPNKYGIAGMIAATAAGEAVPATHGTLGKFDVHNTLIAAGPDFRAGTTDELPTSNLDVAPTILHLLGIKPLQSFDGRVLEEALVRQEKLLPRVEQSALEATRAFPSGVWRQQLRISKLGPYIYFDEGNGRFAD
ncbi:MAG: alkaline phosphatase family protein [Chthoniobacterales bacterium]|nr:alkaline phosphatase family protein [Chthoniobacterales bacterium]